jgi:hypothetical protein
MNSLLGSSPFLVYIMSGMIAEAISCIVFVPVDVIKERLQVQSTNNVFSNHFPSSSSLSSSSTATISSSAPSSKFKYYANSFDALKTILREEGLTGIYKGYGATLLSYGPYSSLYFLFYETVSCKMTLHSFQKKSTHLVY